jgi:hypothetical protein
MDREVAHRHDVADPSFTDELKNGFIDQLYAA